MERRIKWEFIQLTSSGRVPIPSGTIEVRFFFNSSASLTVALINQTFGLSAYNQFTAGGTLRYPYELILINNPNEIDNTVYDIKMNNGELITVTYKYFQKN